MGMGMGMGMGTTITMTIFEAGDLGRDEVEDAIISSFKKRFGANNIKLLETLVALDDGNIKKYFGVSKAPPFFLECYLERNIESILNDAFGKDISLSEVAELGNLSGDNIPFSEVIKYGYKYLKGNGIKYIVFTGTKQLERALTALSLTPIKISAASKQCVPNPTSWGTYYNNNPSVYAMAL